jgi:hypothetical protein
MGDVHGCYNTLMHLIDELGGHDGIVPDDVLLVSVGDLNNKGGVVGVEDPNGPLNSGSVQVLRWAMDRYDDRSLLVTDSNHGRRLGEILRSGIRTDRDGNPLRGSVVPTLADIDAQPDAEELAPRLASFLLQLPHALRVSGGPAGEIVAAHAAASPRLLDAKKLSYQERMFHINAQFFRWTGQQTVVTGHVLVDEPTRERHKLPDGSLSGEVIRLESGCYRGRGLSAYIADEDTIITVPTDERDIRPHRRRSANNENAATAKTAKTDNTVAVPVR